MTKKLHFSGLDLVVGQMFKYSSRTNADQVSVQIIYNREIRNKKECVYRAAVYVFSLNDLTPKAPYYGGLVNIHGKNDIPELTEQEYDLARNKLESLIKKESIVDFDKLSKGAIKEYK